MIKFVNELRQVCGFLQVLQFPPPIIWLPWYNWNIAESGIKHPNPNPCVRIYTCELHPFLPKLSKQFSNFIQTYELLRNNLTRINLSDVRSLSFFFFLPFFPLFFPFFFFFFPDFLPLPFLPLSRSTAYRNKIHFKLTSYILDTKMKHWHFFLCCPKLDEWNKQTLIFK